MDKLKILKNCIELSSSIKIYIPSTIDIDKEIDNSKVVEETNIFLSQLFGGATSSKALGAWVTANKNLVTEKVTLVFSYCTETQLQENIETVYTYCVKMKKDLLQESIALEVNNKLYLI